MGIKLNVNMKQDYSYLFQGLSSGNGNSLGNLNFLSDYASIKNGSYGKLMKAYYAKDDTAKEVVSSAKANKNNKLNTLASADTAKTLSDIQAASEKLKDTADELIAKGKDSVFEQKDITTTNENGHTTTTKGYDADAIYKKVNEFVQNYNSLLEKAAESNTNKILNKSLSLINVSASNENLLEKVGITINEDDTLSVDEKAFKNANMTTIKSLFNGNASYAYRVSAQASLIDFAASTESSKANTYTMNGSYGNTYSSGSIFDSLF